MGIHHQMRPGLYADAITGTVLAAARQGRIPDLECAARRVAPASGLSPVMAARDLLEGTGQGSQSRSTGGAFGRPEAYEPPLSLDT
jgi:hypothetical protein